MARRRRRGALVDFTVEVNEGEVVLDIIHRLQATQAPDLAVRWNCKAGKCGSCSAEINGRPRLLCMTRMSTFAEDETITVTPMRTFPVIRDLVTDVSFNYDKARQVPAFAPPATWRRATTGWQQVDVERSQEFRKCIECFLCQDVCHVVRDHEDNKPAFAGPALPHAHRRARHAPARPASTAGPRRREEHGLGLVQHHQVLHRGLPRAHQDHRQRADPAEGARRRPQVRSRWCGWHTRSGAAGGRPPRLTRPPFFARPSLEVAPALLGASSSRTAGVTVRLTEVEAYDGPRRPGLARLPRAHPAHRGDVRAAGHLYVYFSYGMHWCANLVCGREGTAPARSCCGPARWWRASTLARARRRRQRPTATWRAARPGWRRRSGSPGRADGARRHRAGGSRSPSWPARQPAPALRPHRARGSGVSGAGGDAARTRGGSGWTATPPSRRTGRAKPRRPRAQR